MFSVFSYVRCGACFYSSEATFWDPFSWMYRSLWGSTPYRNRSRPRWAVCQWLIIQQMAPADVGTFCDCLSPALLIVGGRWSTEASTYNPSNPTSLLLLVQFEDPDGPPFFYCPRENREIQDYDCCYGIYDSHAARGRFVRQLPLCPGTCCQWLERLAGLAVIFDGCDFQDGGSCFLKRFTFCKWRCSKTEVVKNKSLAYPIQIDQWWFTSASSTPEACLPCASLQTWPWDMRSARWRKCWGHLATDRISMK